MWSGLRTRLLTWIVLLLGALGGFIKDFSTASFFGVLFQITFLVVTAIAIEVFFLIYNKILRYKNHNKSIVGTWINHQKGSNGLYSIFVISFKEENLKVEGRVYSIFFDRFITEWQSVCVIAADHGNSLYYLYHGVPHTFEDLPRAETHFTYGFCFLGFQVSGGAIGRGEGYFIDDKPVIVKQNDQNSVERQIRGIVNTEYERIDKTLLRKLNLKQKLEIKKVFSSDPKAIQELVLKYHEKTDRRMS